MWRWFLFCWVLSTMLFLLTGCASSQPVDSRPVATHTEDDRATATPAPAATPPNAAVHNPDPTNTPAPIVTPEIAPSPEPVALTSDVVTDSDCCGLFDWIDSDHLLVFDQPTGREDGSYVIDLFSGRAALVSQGFGIPSPSGMIAMLEPGTSDLVIRDIDGEQLASIETNGQPAWPSPDGTVVAWLEPLPVRVPSSSVNRQVQLKVSDVGGTELRTVAELQSQEIRWLPDNQRIVTIGRGRDFQSPGIWLIDTDTNEVTVLHEETFVRSLELSPDGRHVAFMRLFNDDPADNGVFVLNIETGDLQYAFETGPYRWDADGQHLWRLQMGATGVEADQLVRFDPSTGSVVEVIDLDGQVLNEQWALSPDGEKVAFWRYEDGMVVVQALR